MRIDCFFNHQAYVAIRPEEKNAIVIDVLRATSSFIIALANGAKDITPFSEIDAARAEKAQRPLAILSGEREGNIINGFDIGNSPYDFSPAMVKGRSLISCTTNGTSAICAAREAKNLWLGALLNAPAVAKTALIEQSDLVIVCAGTTGSPSLDDILAAGAIIKHIMEERIASLNDAALIAKQIYGFYASDLYEGLLQAEHGAKLHRMGRGKEIEFCAQEGIYNICPYYDKISGVITL